MKSSPQILLKEGPSSKCIRLHHIRKYDSNINILETNQGNNIVCMTCMVDVR